MPLYGHNEKIVTIIVATMEENKHCDLIYGHNQKVVTFSTLKITMMPLDIRSEKNVAIGIAMNFVKTTKK